MPTSRRVRTLCSMMLAAFVVLIPQLALSQPSPVLDQNKLRWFAPLSRYDLHFEDADVDTWHDTVGGIWPDWPPDAPEEPEPDVDDMVESDLVGDDVTAGDAGDMEEIDG